MSACQESVALKKANVNASLSETSEVFERVFDTQVKLGNTVKNVLSFEKLRNTSISEPSLFVSGVRWDGHH